MSLMKKYRASCFYIITYLLTGGLFLLTAVVQPYFEFPFYLLAPAVTAFFMVGIIDKSGIKSFVKPLFPAQKNIYWLMISIVIPIMIVFASDVIFRMLHGKELNYLTSAHPLNIGFLAMVLIGSIGEEIGWRGYLLQLLNEKHRKLLSSVIVGLLWGFWHVGDYGEGFGFLLFVLSTIGMSIMMTWLYYMSGKSIVTAISFHFAYNLAASYVGIIPEGGVPHIIYRLIMAVACITSAMIIVRLSSVFRETTNNS